MKRLFTFLLMALGWCFSMSAQVPQGWTVSEDLQEKGRMVIYATLNAWVDAEYAPVAAFIDGECRGLADVTSLNNGTDLLTIEVFGTEADNGKTVTFKYCKSDMIYALSQTATYDYGESPYKPSEPLELTVNPIAYFTLSEETVEMYVGSTINLMDYITFEPEDAQIPENAELWSLGNYTTQFTLTGNSLKALEVGEYSIKYTGPGKGMGGFQLQIKVSEKPVPIEEIWINEQFNGAHINVGDYYNMTLLLNNCYVLLPVNTNEVPEWSCSSATGIVKTETDGGEVRWIPAEVGTYTMTLTAANASATLTVYVDQPVTGMQVYGETIYTLIGGENVAEVMPFAYTILPANATDKSVTFEIADETILNKKFTPLKVGTTTVKITSENNPQANGTVTVVVQPSYEITVVKNQIDVELESDPTDITSEIKANVTTSPETTVTFESSDEAMLSISGSGNSLSALLHKTGTATVYAEVRVPYTVVVNGQLSLSGNIVDNSYFTVVATPAVTGITLLYNGDYPIEEGERIELSNYEIDYYALQAQPEGAVLKPELLSTPFTYTYNPVNASSDVVEVVEKDGVLGLKIYPNAVSKGQLTIDYENLHYEYPVQVDQAFDSFEGWKWVNFYAGPYDVKTFAAFTEDFVEARGQQKGQLVYNDPEYGLFGQLQTFQANTAYKVKTSALDSGYLFVTCTEMKPYCDIPLLKTWTWLAFPYQFNEDLTQALAKYEAADGDRIISMDGGFVEYSASSHSWVGNLTTLVAGESYLYYNTSGEAKTMTIQPEFALKPNHKFTTRGEAPRRVSQHTKVWSYNPGQFADNMTIIASLEGEDDAEHCHIGAFVNGECRGEGEYIDGKFFLTVHGQTGELVEFRLYNEAIDEFADVATTLKFGQMAGSLQQPLVMEVPVATAITHLEQTNADKAVYDLSGRKTRATQKGIYIIDGKAVVR